MKRRATAGVMDLKDKLVINERKERGGTHVVFDSVIDTSSWSQAAEIRCSSETHKRSFVPSRRPAISLNRTVGSSVYRLTTPA